MNAVPKLSDIKLKNVQFKPGDRLLAKVSVNLSDEERQKLRRTIKKFAGTDVRILIIDCTVFRLLMKRGEQVFTLIRASDIDGPSTLPSIVNLTCSAYQFQKDDVLILKSIVMQELTPLKKSELKKQLQRWAGNDVEVIVF